MVYEEMQNIAECTNTENCNKCPYKETISDIGFTICDMVKFSEINIRKVLDRLERGE